MKYSPELTKRITDLIERDTFTIPEVCKAVGISEATFHKWNNDKKEFLEAVKKAKECQFENMAILANKGMVKLLEGYDAKEETIVYASHKTVDKATGEVSFKKYIKEQKTVTKHIPINSAIVIFTKSNTDPRFKRTDQPETTTNNSENSINITVQNKEQQELINDLIDKFNS